MLILASKYVIFQDYIKNKIQKLPVSFLKNFFKCLNSIKNYFSILFGLKKFQVVNMALNTLVLKCFEIYFFFKTSYEK